MAEDVREAPLMITNYHAFQRRTNVDIAKGASGDLEMLIPPYLDAIGIVVSVIRNIHLKRVFDARSEPQQNFWRIVSGNFMDVSVIEWCKLFGSDDNTHQPVHWKNLIGQAEHGSFRAGLRTATGMSQAQWDRYWEQMKAYRDKNAAHHDPTPPRPVTWPDLGAALSSAYYYYDRIYALVPSIGITYPRDIRSYGDRFATLSAIIADSALAATDHIQDKVR